MFWRSTDCFRVKSVWRWAIVGRLSADSRPTSYEEKHHLDSDNVVRSVGDSRHTDGRRAFNLPIVGGRTDGRRAFNLPIVGRLSPDCIDCCRRSTGTCNQPIAAPIKTRPNLPFLYLLDVFFLRNKTYAAITLRNTVGR